MTTYPFSEVRVRTEMFLEQMNICLKEPDEEQRLCGLRTVCYHLFSRASYCYPHNNPIFYSFTEENPDSLKIAEIIKTKSPILAEFPRRQVVKGGPKSSEYWKPNSHVQKDTWVKIKYGGGLNYLLDCFEGRERGYARFGSCIGIRVYPTIPTHFENGYRHNVTHFSQNVPIAHFDFPVVLTAWVMAKYLIPTHRHREAGIKVDDLKFLRDAKITLHLDPKTTDIEKLGDLPTQKYQKKIVRFNRLISASVKERLMAFNAGKKLDAPGTISLEGQFPTEKQTFQELFLSRVSKCMEQKSEALRLCQFRSFCYELFQLSDHSRECSNKLFDAFTEEQVQAKTIANIMKKHMTAFAWYPNFNPNMKTPTKGEYWGKCWGLPPTTEVEISHGGGLNFLLDCFEGKERGYRLERGIGVGLQVHPHAPPDHTNSRRNRVFHYARNIPIRHFDFPAILTGKVPAKYLLTANKGYEAGIRVHHLKHLKEAKIILHLDPATTDLKDFDDSKRNERYWKKIVFFNRWISGDLQKRLETFNKKSSD